MKKAFSLLELFLAITLAGVMALLTLNYFDTKTLTKLQTKTQLQSHFDIITAAILQCKSLSSRFPLQSDGSEANATALDTLECNTSVPYALDGGRGAFIPAPLPGFEAYSATQSGSVFYFTTGTSQGSIGESALQELSSVYSAAQYSLRSDAENLYLDFYLSR